jgi:predicted DNA-binding transcriptional regulator AlpA
VSASEEVSESDAVSQLRWLTVADIASILGVSRQTIYNRVSQSPESLPPITWVPGLRGPRWSPRIVREWQALFDPAGLTVAPRRGGRPTKAESIARRRLLNR